jgi:hypothetical protein
VGWFAKRRAARQAEAEARATGTARYQELLGRVGTDDPTTLRKALEEAEPATGLRTKEIDKLKATAFLDYVEKVLADDILNEEEEAQFLSVASSLGVEQEDLQTEYKYELNRLVVARVNDGRLPEITEPHVLLKAGEVVHLETQAALMKEVAIREYRGGYQGMSFRIAKGVRYHVGGTRGKNVVVGTQLQVADAGVLAVTSNRVVFMGGKSTMEMPYAKLVNLNVFSDGIQFHVSNRKSAPLFKLESGDVIAAIVNAAVQRLN